MKWAAGLGLTALLATAESRPAAQTESPHQKGPHGLEGWTILAPIETQGDLPVALVIAHDKRIVRKFPGDGFVWKWTFVNGGRQVAYESGPLHFALACVLADIRTGKERARFNCFSDPLPQDAPAWVKELETP